MKKRNELKEKIVEKRVADLLREPDQLSWEPVAANESRSLGYAYPQAVIAQPRGTMTVETNSAGQRKYVTTMQGASGQYTARKTKRMVTETIEDENGKKRAIMRPVEETGHVETQVDESRDPVSAEPAARLRPSTNEAIPLNTPRFKRQDARVTSSGAAINGTRPSDTNS